MAAILDLVYREDLQSDIDVLHLKPCASEDGFNLLRDGWVPGELDESSGRVPEAIKLTIKGSNHNDLAANIQKLALKAREANQYSDSSEYRGVWLRTQLSGETYARQSLITKARHHAISAIMAPYVHQQSIIQEYGLELERTPYWEKTTYDTYIDEEIINSVGGYYDYDAVTGDQAARIALCRIANPAESAALERFWLGFRSDRYGGHASFVPTWCLELGTMGTDTTGAHSNADSTAKDGYKTVTTFATPTMMRRVTETVYNVAGANASKQRGEFLVLLRAKLSAAGTVQAQLVDGSYSTDSTEMRVQDRVTITGTDWSLYEMGTVLIPSPKQIGTSHMSLFSLAIDAEQTSGSPHLDMDCLVLIPIDEGFVSCKNFTVLFHEAGSDNVNIYQTADGFKYGYCETYSGSSYMTMAPIAGGGLPIGAGRAIIATQELNKSVLTQNVMVTLLAYGRFDQLRGST